MSGDKSFRGSHGTQQFQEKERVCSHHQWKFNWGIQCVCVRERERERERERGHQGWIMYKYLYLKLCMGNTFFLIFSSNYSSLHSVALHQALWDRVLRAGLSVSSCCLLPLLANSQVSSGSAASNTHQEAGVRHRGRGEWREHDPGSQCGDWNRGEGGKTSVAGRRLLHHSVQPYQ